MRLALLPLFLVLAQAQDPRIKQQPQAHVQLPFSAAAPNPTPTPTGTVERLYGVGKRLFDAAILGKTPQEDTNVRDERDKVDGVERLMKENWSTITEGPVDHVWIIHISGPPRDYIDFRFLDTHKNATRLTREHQAKNPELKKFHFARVDYMREVEICTRWLVFSSPIIAFVSDQGETVRWAPKGIAGAGGDFLFEILESGRWENLPVWTSRYAPGGDRAYVVDFYLNSSDYVSAQMARVPAFVWMGMFAAITQGVVKWLHSPKPRTGALGPQGPAGANVGRGAGSKRTQ